MLIEPGIEIQIQKEEDKIESHEDKEDEIVFDKEEITKEDNNLKVEV